MDKISKEQLEKIEESWDKHGECRSCGWHSAFYEVKDEILPMILDDNNLESDGSFWLSCSCNEDNDVDYGRHRGIWLYDFKLN